jgi:hypothetical protein
VRFDISLNAGAGAFETAETFHFVGNELIVWRVLQGQEPFKEDADIGGPRTTMDSAAWFGTIADFIAQESRAQLVEPRTAHSKMVSCGYRIKVSRVEVAEDTTDEFDR